MRALYYSQYGDPSVLKVGDVPDIHPGPGEVLIKVAGAGLNPVDSKIRQGALAGIFDVDFPIIPGWDVSGTVGSVGDGVAADWIGRKVYAYGRREQVEMGTCAQYCVLPESVLAEPPVSMGLVEASTVPLVALTAYQSLHAEGGLKASDTVLVLAGAGAVGRYAIQMAKAAGASVVATARSDDHRALQALGAQQCIDYRDIDWAVKAAALTPNGYSIILDAVGGETLEACYDLVAQNGVIIGLNDPPDEARLAAKPAKGVRLFSMPNGQQLQEITTWINAGHIQPLTVQVMALDDAQEAHELLDKGAREKIALALP